MSATVLYMSMSLDGFIADQNEDPSRLHEWLSDQAPSHSLAATDHASGANGQVVDEFMSTGAVVAGRRTFEPAGGWGGDHHDGVPIFIVSRQQPGIDISRWPLVTYLTDVTIAMNRAKAAAADKDVLVHGAATAQLALTAGLLDELEIHLVPVLLGRGRRLFDHLRPGDVELERIRILEGEHGVTHMRYRVRR